MNSPVINPGTFGELSLPQGGIATYRAFAVPKMNDGFTLLTYIAGPANELVELPSANLPSAKVKVDEVGHIMLVGP